MLPTEMAAFEKGGVLEVKLGEPAGGIAQPPMVALVTRLRLSKLPNYTARRLPDLPTERNFYTL